MATQHNLAYAARFGLLLVLSPKSPRMGDMHLVGCTDEGQSALKKGASNARGKYRLVD